MIFIFDTSLVKKTQQIIPKSEATVVLDFSTDAIGFKNNVKFKCSIHCVAMMANCSVNFIFVL